MSVSFRSKTKTNSFQADIAHMMEAIGFDNILPETLDTIEEIVITYLVDIFNEATRSVELHGRPKVKLDDFRFALRKDKEKMNRIDELNRTFKLIDENKKTFNSKNDYKTLKMITDTTNVAGITGKVGKSSRKGMKYKKRGRKPLPKNDKSKSPSKVADTQTLGNGDDMDDLF